MTTKPVTMIRNTSHGAGTIERMLRQQLSQPGNAISEAAGWDSSNASRFLSGQQGVSIGKIDAVVHAAGYVLVSKKYFDAINTLSEVGVNCRCAREGAGECGPNQQSACGGCQ